MQNDRDIVLISVFTFLTVLLWISFELIKTTKTTTVTTNVAQIITPLNPKMDGSVLDILQTKKTY